MALGVGTPIELGSSAAACDRSGEVQGRRVGWSASLEDSAKHCLLECVLRLGEEAGLRRLGDKCLREHAWTTRQKEEVTRG